MVLIKSFKKISKKDTLIVGGKGASLGEMTKLGMLVPKGFVILSNAFDKFIEKNGLNIKIAAALNEVNIKEDYTVKNASEKIKDMIFSKEIPNEIKSEILKSYKKIDSKLVAVRSSATLEDSASASWAGQLESYLNITEETLLENVKKCWASLFTPRAIFYRFEKKLNKHKISVAVVVQKMIDSEISGIAFSVHPSTQNKNQILIEAGFGLGEAIVSGQITPDSYIIAKNDLNILDKKVYTQKRGMYKNSQNNGNEWKSIPEKKGQEQCLSNQEIIDLSRLIVKIENHYGFPCDIEWAKEKDKFYILQSRPITTLTKTEYETENFKSKKKIFNKEFSRPYSLFRICATDKGMQEVYKIIGIDAKDICFIHKGKDLVDFYYEENQFQELFIKITELTNKKIGEAKENLRRFEDLFNELLPYYLENKKIKTIEEFRKVYGLYSKLSIYVVLLFIYVEGKGLPDFINKKGLELREMSQQYDDAIEKVFNNFIKSNYLWLDKKYNLLLPDEISQGIIETSNKNKLLKEIAKRKKGFVYYRGELYQGNPEKIVDKLNIILSKPEVLTSNEIKGSIAFHGRAIGKVRIITSEKQIKKFKKGEILVSPMIMPNYLPAVMKASALVTDEGSTACHAAIIAREMKKPCIVGTKIATHFLKDGDKVKVDANLGIIKKMN